MPEAIKAKLIEKEYLKNDILRFKVEAKNIVQTAKPGNFIEIRVTDTTEPFLRRPISIYNLEKEEGTLEFIFQIKGEGTRLLSKKQEGDLIDIVGPLGMGTFKLNNYQNIAVIGGGIGVFPLYELSKEANKENRNVNIYLGFRDKENVLLEDEFKNVSKKLVITTDNGTYGIKGFKYRSPTVKEMKVEGSVAIISFNYAPNGLIAKNGEVKGVYVAGKNKKWYKARSEEHTSEPSHSGQSRMPSSA